MAKKSKTETKAAPRAPASNKKPKKAKTKSERLPREAESLEHTLRRVAADRERERREKFGI